METVQSLQPGTEPTTAEGTDMTDVSTFEDIDLPADTVWKVIGGFRRNPQMGSVGEG